MNAYALAETERLLANLIRVGTVAALDAAAARVTLWAITRPPRPFHASRPGPRPVW